MPTLLSRWHQAITNMPLIAILRGITPEEAVDVAEVLIDAGFLLIEVPLNSPTPYKTIEKLVLSYGEKAIVGAGTVLTPDQVTATIDAGGKLIVAPNLNPLVASAACSASTMYCPGVATPTEAFSALEQGAAAIKLFPAELIQPQVVSAMRAVLPPETVMLPVGGISPDNMQPYIGAGAKGFGIGSAIYKPGKSVSAVGDSARRFVSAFECLVR